jgi:hypothetical protein
MYQTIKIFHLQFLKLTFEFDMRMFNSKVTDTFKEFMFNKNERIFKNYRTIQTIIKICLAAAILVRQSERRNKQYFNFGLT